MVHIIFIIALFCMIPDLNKKYPFRYFALAVLFLFMALRYDYGNDYMDYYNNHILINAGHDAWGSRDFLFNILNKLTPDFFLLIAIISLFYIITINYLIKKNLNIKQYWFATLILLINPYIFLVQLSSIRQTLAICFFVFAVTFAIKRKILLYLLFVFLAIGMHESAIILLPIYFILTEKPLNKKYVLLTTIFVLTLIFTPLFDLIMNIVLEYMPKNYRYYYEKGLQNSVRATLISSFFFFLLVFNFDKLKGKEIIYGKLSLISTIISLLAYKVSMLTRIGMYFDIFMIITIPTVFIKMDKGLKRNLLILIMLTIYLLRYYSFFTNPLWESFVKYQTILNR